MKTSRFARFFGRVAATSLIFAALPGIALADLNEEQKLSPPSVPGAKAGQASAIFGDTALVGAPNDSGDVVGCQAGAGAAYVYTRSLTIWTKVATLCASDGVSGDQFGAAVSLSSGNIAIGAPGRNSNAGAVYTFTGGGASWAQNPNVLIAAVSAGSAAGRLGTSVSTQGFTVVAGAPTTLIGRIEVGVAIAFNSIDSGATWTRFTFRPTGNGGNSRKGGHFGTAVSLSGSTVLVGAPTTKQGSHAFGAAFIFINNGGVWTQQARLAPSKKSGEMYGTAVWLSANTAVFGATGANNGKGSVYVYTRTGTTWTQQNTITASGGVAGDLFGSSVSNEGSLVFVGAPAANSGGGKGYEFSKSGNNYSLINALVATDNAAGDNFGTSIGSDAGRIIVGAPSANATAGAAYVFKFKQPSVTTITCFSSDSVSCVPQEPSLTGVPYTVFVHVDHVAGDSGTPTGSVDLDDSQGGVCSIPTLDGSGNGSCQLTSNFFGQLTMTASYGGDFTFAPSIATAQHAITGNHLVFNPAPPNVLQGNTVNGLIVNVVDGADALITSDSTTQVTVTVDDSCGNSNVIGTLTLTNGVADFSGLGPKFYTLAVGLGVQAVSNNATSAAHAGFDVVNNPDLVFADSFEDCTP